LLRLGPRARFSEPASTALDSRTKKQSTYLRDERTPYHVTCYFLFMFTVFSYFFPFRFAPWLRHTPPDICSSSMWLTIDALVGRLQRHWDQYFCLSIPVFGAGANPKASGRARVTTGNAGPSVQDACDSFRIGVILLPRSPLTPPFRLSTPHLKPKFPSTLHPRRPPHAAMGVFFLQRRANAKSHLLVTVGRRLRNQANVPGVFGARFYWSCGCAIARMAISSSP